MNSFLYQKYGKNQLPFHILAKKTVGTQKNCTSTEHLIWANISVAGESHCEEDALFSQHSHWKEYFPMQCK
jgi:hypothetical protein